MSYFYLVYKCRKAAAFTATQSGNSTADSCTTQCRAPIWAQIFMQSVWFKNKKTARQAKQASIEYFHSRKGSVAALLMQMWARWVTKNKTWEQRLWDETTSSWYELNKINTGRICVWSSASACSCSVAIKVTNDAGSLLFIVFGEVTETSEKSVCDKQCVFCEVCETPRWIYPCWIIIGM